MKAVFSTSVAFLFLSKAAALPAKGDDIQEAPRFPTQCGDPNTAMTFFEGFKPSLDSHAPDDIPDFVSLSSGGDVWNFDPPSFRAWIAPGQANTIPFYWLHNTKTEDYVYLTSDTTTPPSRSGYGNANLIAYVYPTQICNSVPLYCASKPTDHWYTTNLVEHNNLVSQHGWTDCGITAYVLPINDFSQIVA
ncbi:hypothetical protein CVT26_010584 [Gymnopilus dilepis]|uniref:DUF5648 domain-containing protein n=1 Tax=Gymnopilus dilepis TaxID=231916 RepID=A0A409VZJ3_9AGAR|nr:hypothetical protein CVT26_010584 [Gymnopilus dilepis]